MASCIVRGDGCAMVTGVASAGGTFMAATAPEPRGSDPGVPRGCGLGLLETQPDWSLGLKAEHVQLVQERHNRIGLVAECSLRRFGDISSCTAGQHDSGLY